jgi:hypothetical protein
MMQQLGYAQKQGQINALALEELEDIAVIAMYSRGKPPHGSSLRLQLCLDHPAYMYFFYGCGHKKS